MHVRLVLLAAIAALAVSSCSVILEADVQILEPGDCFDLDKLPDEVGSVQRRPCFGGNIARVAGWTDFSDYDEYPGMREFNGILANWCSRFVDDLETSVQYTVGWLVPTEASWGEGERQALCYYTAQ